MHTLFVKRHVKQLRRINVFVFNEVRDFVYSEFYINMTRKNPYKSRKKKTYLSMNCLNNGEC